MGNAGSGKLVCPGIPDDLGISVSEPGAADWHRKHGDKILQAHCPGIVFVRDALRLSGADGCGGEVLPGDAVGDFPGTALREDLGPYVVPVPDTASVSADAVSKTGAWRRSAVGGVWSAGGAVCGVLCAALFIHAVRKERLRTARGRNLFLLLYMRLSVCRGKEGGHKKSGQERNHSRPGAFTGRRHGVQPPVGGLGPAYGI